MAHMQSLESWSDELLASTIAGLDQKGESLELVRLRREVASRRKKRRIFAGKQRGERPIQTVEQLTSKFWLNVDVNGIDKCWNWKGCTNHEYGLICWTQRSLKSKQGKAHRLAVMIAGKTIPNGMVVMHLCDNTLCCNPNHLEIGTQADNIYDMDAKGRRGRTIGEKNGNTNLTNDEVRKIKSLHLKNWRECQPIAIKHNVETDVIWKIARGITWKDVE